MSARFLPIVLVHALLSACSADNSAWREAETANTAEAYAAFLAEHPGSGHAADARAQLLALFIDAALAEHGIGSILTFYGTVPDLIAPGWTLTTPSDESPLSFVWLDGGLTYIAGSGSASGPAGRSYHFESLLGARDN